MLVVVAIIAVLVALTFGVSKKAMDTAKKTKCLSNLRTIYSYLQAYAQDHDNVMPAGLKDTNPSYRSPTKLLAALEPYVPTESDRSVFYCPAHYRSPGVLNGYNPTRWAAGDFSYFYMQRVGSSIDPRRGYDLNMALLMTDPFNNTTADPSGICHTGGFNIMRLNGAVEFTKDHTNIQGYLNYSN